MAQAVLAACPDNEWRLIFALSRFGGLRCPSETLELKWRDIDWEGGRIVIRESKTKMRTIPLFPEVRTYLELAFDAAPEGAEYVIQRYRGANCNLRTQLLRILTRVGLSAWPRLFHNLRASRETELVREYPIHVVCAWIGNSERVARRHYLQVTDADFEKATSNPTSPMHADGRAGPQEEKETAVKPANANCTAVHIPSTGIASMASGCSGGHWLRSRFCGAWCCMSSRCSGMPWFGRRWAPCRCWLAGWWRCCSSAGTCRGSGNCGS
ncbi:site-specific integrase [bacterium]|nr:site-specific integrase [bacterium]